MKEDDIAEIGIINNYLYIKPSSQTFPFIYRECMGVNWTVENKMLFMTEDVNWKWDFLKCFQQIFCAAREQGCHLMVTANTKWLSISADLKMQILTASKELLSESYKHEEWLKANRTQITEEGLMAEKLRETMLAYDKAQQAFRNQDFSTFVSSLTPYLDYLTSIQLRKFKYAQKKIS